MIAAAGLESRQRTLLVRSLRTYARIRSLTTGTFNLVVKDRIALRLSGAHSVRPNLFMWRGHSCPRVEPALKEQSPRVHTDSIQPSSKPYKHTVPRKTLSIRASHRISTAFPQWEVGPGELNQPKAGRSIPTKPGCHSEPALAGEEPAFDTGGQISEAAQPHPRSVEERPFRPRQV